MKDFDRHYGQAIAVFNKKIDSLNENLSFFKNLDTLLPELETKNDKFTSPFGALLGCISKNYDLILKIEDKLIFDELIQYAENEDADSQYDLAVMYYHGHGVDQDYENSLYWLIRAANNDFPLAQYDLSDIYNDGIITPENMEKSVHYKQLAQKSGQTSGGLLDIAVPDVTPHNSLIHKSLPNLPLIPIFRNTIPDDDLKVYYSKFYDCITLTIMIDGFLNDFLTSMNNSKTINIDHLSPMSERVDESIGLINDIVFKLMTYGIEKNKIDFYANINSSVYNEHIINYN